MSDYKYYTPVALFDVLLDYLPETRIKSVVDISCGSFNLLKSALKRFPDAKCVGVDIEDQVIEGFNNIQFIRQDGREYAKVQHKRKKSFDLILSNPPFGRLKKENRLFEKEDGALLCSRYECEMMYANSLLAKNGTSMIIILPATFVEGDLYSKYRKRMAKDYIIQSIIKLPSTVFSKGEISSYAIILLKTAKNNKEYTNLGNAVIADGRWRIDLFGNICKEKILEGIWIENMKPRPLEKKVEVDAIYRGNISSASFSSRGQKILHCSSSFDNGIWKPTQCFCEVASDTNRKCVQNGDILINRIGKCAGFWTRYEGEEQLISDCLIVIRGGHNIEDFLNQYSVNGRLMVPIKGVATKYISTKDIIDGYFNIKQHK